MNPIRKDGAFIKKQRLNKISKYVVKAAAKGPLSMKKVLAWIQVNVGLTPPKAREYLEVLIDAYEWIVEKNGLTVPKE